MCGIVGVRRFDRGPVTEELLRTMTARLIHRGPDDEGYWSDGSVGLGHRRLSIIDLAGSPQPMSSADGLRHVSFNGEIFNYQALRTRIPYPYRTRGDTEVLLAAYDAWGSAGVAELVGQFAFALFDERDAGLWLFRDRLGVLPLYYYLDKTMVAFASEPKALFPALPGALEVDHDSLGDYLAGRSVPAPNTLFRGIRKLLPGHCLRVTADGHSTLTRYWTIPEEGTGPVSGPEAVDLVAAALERSVADALVADVPVGAYLSGGVDSSIIVALMSRLRGGQGVETFAAGFGDPRLDELSFASQVSRQLGTRHHEVLVSAADFQELWPRLTWHRDAPISEPADVAVFKLAALARQHVKVVLSGEGSDELFAGYPKYRAGRVAAAADLIPFPVRSKVSGTLDQFLPAGATKVRILLNALACRDQDERFRSWFAPFTDKERRSMLGTALRPWQPDVIQSATGDVIRRMLYVDCHAWLSDNLLERGDRMSMAASLELRPPFLDHRLVELAFTLPSRYKLRRGVGKWVVKEVARRYLPANIVDRPKAGFRVPLERWFRSELSDMAHDRLLSRTSFVTEVLDRTAVNALLEGHGRGHRNEEIRIWALLALEVWHDVFFGAPSREGRGMGAFASD